MKILHLTLKRKWFDLIAERKKTIEYREVKPYWNTRLIGKRYHEVCFRNGYSKNAPFIRSKLISIVNVKFPGSTICQPKNGEKLYGWYYAIVLGEILEISHNHKIQRTKNCR